MQYFPSVLEGYKHSNKGIRLNKHGKLCKFSSLRPKNKYHNVTTYMEIIEKYDEKSVKKY